MKKLVRATSKVACFAVLILLGIMTTPIKADVVLKNGTPIPMQLVNTVSSKNAAVGQIVNFKVTSDIQAEGKVVIPAGTLAKAQIGRVKKSGIFGKEGEIQLVINSVTAVDGTEVYLSGGTISDEGSNKLILSLFICMFIKGSSGEIAAGYQASPMVSSNTTIQI